MSSVEDLCLLCLNNSNPLQSVECKGSNGFTIKQNLELFLPEEIKFDSNIKPLVCSSCSEVLTTIVTFSIFCTNNIRQYVDKANKSVVSNNLNMQLKTKLQNIKTENLRKLRSNENKSTKQVLHKNLINRTLKLKNDKKEFRQKIETVEKKANFSRSICNDTDMEGSLYRKRKRHYCTFCTKVITKIENHLVKFHSKQKELKKILILPEGRRRNKLMRDLIKSRIKEFNANEITEKIDYGVDKIASDVLRYHIFPILKDDEITDLIRYDKIIIRYANKLADKLNSKSSHITIRARLRLLGHFISKMKKADPRITCFESILNTQNFKTAINVALDERKNSPNSIYHMNIILKQILLFLTVDYFKKGDKRINRAKEFYFRLRETYSDKYKVRIIGKEI